MAALAPVIQLLRARMTIISAITYASSTLLSPAPIPPRPFLTGYLFVLLTQFAAHALGDHSDYASDALNATATPITGGSRALLRRPGGPPAPLPRAFARSLGLSLCAAAALLILGLPPAARPLAAAILALAHAYGAPPLLLNHRGHGEVGAALITNVLLPLFAFAVVADGGGGPASPTRTLRALRAARAHPAAALLVFPAFYVKVGAFLVLNAADRRPDWATGKRTRAVLLGGAWTARAVALLHAAAYAHVLLLWASGAPAPLALALLASAPYGCARVVGPLWARPYRLDALLAPALLHATLLVWPFALYYVPARVVAGLSGGLSVEVLFVAAFAYVTLGNMRRARAAGGGRGVAPLRAQPVAAMAPLGSGGRGVARAVVLRYDRPLVGGAGVGMGVCVRDVDVVVVGGGVAGLVTAVCLRNVGLSAVVLERRPSAAASEGGADVALWPGAIAVLRELGVGDELFERECFPLDRVHMCNMDFRERRATVLKSIDMRAVTRGTGERFVLVARKPLMRAIYRLLDAKDVVRFGCNVTRVHESDESDSVTVSYATSRQGRRGVEETLSARIAIGCDGIHSALRRQVVAQAGGDATVRFCGEVCYRGVVDFDACPAHVVDTVKALLPDRPEDRAMRINYGAGLRSSFGYMSPAADPSVAYWWVKEMVPAPPVHRGKLDPCLWPEPLKTLHDVTPDDSFYMHDIEDSDVLPKWSSTRIVLVGDSAHAVSPNMGQGACMAIEDGFVLATHLGRFWQEPDGHLEAFYLYEGDRKPYASAVRSEARTQLRLGQLRHPLAVSMREKLLAVVPGTVLEAKLRGHNFPVAEAISLYKEVLRS